MRGTFHFCLIVLFVLLLPGAARANCSGPVGAAGGLVYNADGQAMQYCDGTNWHVLGAPVKDPSLVGWWRFDDGAGPTVVDSSGNGYDGTLVNGPVWDSSGGKIGGGLLFDGTNDYVDLGAPAKINNVSGAFTISSWIKPAGPGSGAIFSNARNCCGTYNGVTLGQYGGTQKFTLILYNGSSYADLFTNTSIVPGVWQHVVGVYDGSQTSAIYVNGVFDISRTVTFGPGAPATFNSFIGKLGSGGAWPYPGDIDDVRFYNRALSPAEIKALYECSAKEAVLYYEPDSRAMTYCNGQQRVMASPKQPLLSDDVTGGLVGWWKLDEASGTLKDSSGNGSDGTQSGGVTYQPTGGVIDGAIGFDGVDDHILAPDNAKLRLTSGATLSAWVYMQDDSTFATLISKLHFVPSPGPGYEMLIDSASRRLRALFLTKDVYVEFATNTHHVPLNTWTHVAVTYDGKNGYAYIDGQQEMLYNSATTNPLLPGTDNLALGFREAGNQNYLNGRLDDVRIYNRALSATEIQTIYNRRYVGPVGHWTFDEGAGTNAADSSGNGNDGTLTNGPVWTSGKIGKALQFDGTNDYVAVGNVLNMDTGSFSYGGWINITGGVGEDWLIGKKQDGAATVGWQVGVDWINNVLKTRLRDATANVATTAATSLVSDGKWHHLFTVVDRTAQTQTLYVDGISVASSSIATVTGSVDNANQIRIGTNSGGTGSSFFNGMIDDVRVYDRALSPAEVQALYNSVAGTCTNPAKPAGTVIYNVNAGAPQYCDGTNWVGMKQ